MKRNFWREKIEFRTAVCAIVLSVLFGLLLVRLWQVQVLQGSEYLYKTTQQSVRPIRLNPVRGRIFSSEGVPLADNISHYDLAIYISKMRQPGSREKTLDYIMRMKNLVANLLHRESPLMREDILKHMRQRPVLPMIWFNNLSDRDVAIISEITPPLPGVVILPRNERSYPMGSLASHILGFTAWNWPDGREVQQDYSRIYLSRELQGRSGLEKLYNEALSGNAGAQLVQVDSLGYVHQQLEKIAVQHHGSDLILTIDTKAQKIAEDLLEGYVGAMVLMDVHTGAVLAMASAPTYDVSRINYNRYQELRAREKTDMPMLNRAVNGFYTPGSIIKPLTALAALQCGAITPETTYECIGYYKLGNVKIHCAKRWGHGVLDLRHAISVSCNPYFINTGIKTGIDHLAPMYIAAGLGERTGIELTEYNSSLAPYRGLAQKLWNRNWLTIDTAYISMGQGPITVSPLQMAVYVSALANGGKIMRPYIIQALRGADGSLEKVTTPKIRHRLPVLPAYLQCVKDGMIMAVEEPGASAASLKDAGIQLAAKTGTAEVGSGKDKYKNTWIICYGPAEEPAYALACVIEHGRSGGRTVGPLVKSFFLQWLGAE
ncbi:MAG: penicillin-binding protein 2 [Lentisphaeria bacterium]